MAAKLLRSTARGQIKRLFSAPKATTALSTSPGDAKHGGNQEKLRETHFGFESVKEEEKVERVYKVFENVADKYDVMNDAMSAGVHQLWKDAFMERLGPTSGSRLVDVAGGTGDIAFRFLNYIENNSAAPWEQPEEMFDIEIPDYVKDGSGTPVWDNEQQEEEEEELTKQQETHVTVCDINQAMLDMGKTRAARLGHTKGISWVKGNAECLPLDDEYYDAYTISFGIRNTTHIDKVLEEAYRVLKPGGRFMCLEFSHVSNPLLKEVYDQYSFQVIPVLGQLIANDWKSYQYLVESIRQFPKQEVFTDMIREAGFGAVTYENLMSGVAAIHSGFKL